MSDRPFTYDPLYSNPELMRYAMKFAGMITPEDKARQLAANEEASRKAERTDRPPVVPIEVRPLNVRVAEALGWNAHLSKHGHFIVTHGRRAETPGEICEEGFGRYDPETRFDSRTGRKLPERTAWWEDCSHVPAFDTSWEATGPLIEKYWISVGGDGSGVRCMHDGCFWVATHRDPEKYESACGPTALVAVCNLILSLKQAGKLAV